MIKEECDGHRHFKLTDLWKLDENKFRQLKFRVRDNVAIKENAGDIFIVNKNDEPLGQYCKGSPEVFFLSHIKQGLGIHLISMNFSSEYKLPIDEGFQRVREIALQFVQQGICIPANDVHYEP
ncbi:MAG: hypothetical protein ACOY90_08100 [Candidatus Zhuqueibacterota bacterium]